MFTASVAFAFTHACTKVLTGYYHPSAIIFFRSLINVLILLFFVRKKITVLLSGPFRKTSVVWLRGLLGFTGYACYVTAIAHLPVSIATMIAHCAPLFTIAFARIVLGEKQSRQAWIWTGVAFVGLFLLTRPAVSLEQALPGFYLFLAVLGSFFSGMAFLSIRAATEEFSDEQIVFGFALTSLLMTLPWLSLNGFRLPESHAPDLGIAAMFFLILLIGILATVAQEMMTKAYRMAPASTVSVLGLMSGVFTALLGIAFLGESLSSMQWVGGGVLLLGVGQVSRFKTIPVKKHKYL